jgi:hypothetical protein
MFMTAAVGNATVPVIIELEFALAIVVSVPVVVSVPAPVVIVPSVIVIAPSDSALPFGLYVPPTIVNPPVLKTFAVLAVKVDPLLTYVVPV